MHREIGEMRSAHEKEMENEQQLIQATSKSFKRRLQSLEFLSNERAQKQRKLKILKKKLRQWQDELATTLADKTRREAKQVSTMEFLASVRASTEELKKLVQEQRARKDEYANLISQQSLALEELEEKSRHTIFQTKEIEQANSWYNSALGIQVEGGHGVKFIFNNINPEHPKECSFTILHENNGYNLLDSSPNLEDTMELVNELNRTNNLFKFVRIMRERFQSCTQNELHRPASHDTPTTVPDSVLSPSAKSESLASEAPPRKARALLKEINGLHNKPAPSPGSASIRRSARLMVPKKGTLS